MVDQIVLGRVEDFLNQLNSITNGGNDNIHEPLREVIGLMGGKEDKARLLTALDGMVNRNASNMRVLFMAEGVTDEVIGLGYAIIDIANSTWDFKDISETLTFLKESALKPMPELCGEGGLNGMEFEFLTKMLKALSGDLLAFGEVSDHLVFKNKSMKC